MIIADRGISFHIIQHLPSLLQQQQQRFMCTFSLADETDRHFVLCVCDFRFFFFFIHPEMCNN